MPWRDGRNYTVSCHMECDWGKKSGHLPPKCQCYMEYPWYGIQIWPPQPYSIWDVWLYVLVGSTWDTYIHPNHRLISTEQSMSGMASPQKCQLALPAQICESTNIMFYLNPNIDVSVLQDFGNTGIKVQLKPEARELIQESFYGVWCSMSPYPKT